MNLTFRSVLASGQSRLDTGMRDVVIVQLQGSFYAFATSELNGGLISARLSPGASALLIDTQVFSAQISPFASGALTLVQTGGQTALMVGQDARVGLVGYSLDVATGQFGAATQTQTSFASGDITASAAAPGSYLLANATQETVLLQSLAPQGGSIDLSVPIAGFATGISGLAHLTVGSTDFVYAISTVTNSVLSWQVNTAGTAASYLGQIGAANGLGMATPTALATAVLLGQTFLVVAGAGSNSLTVLRVGADGGLTPTDHILDTLNTRFADVQAIATVQAAGQIFVLAGGSDDGISLFSLMPDGRLLHRDTLVHDTGMGLLNVTAIAAAVIGSEVQVLITTEGGAGLVQLAFSVAGLAAPMVGGTTEILLQGGAGQDLLVGSTQNDTLYGGAGDDVLQDGAGIDVMSGGDGRDIFVISIDGLRDVIADFQPGQDMIDLSGLPMLYDFSQLVVNTTSRGLRLTVRGEQIDFYHHSGLTLTPAQILAGILWGADRPPLFFSDDIWGGGMAELLSGSARNETLTSEAGDDSLLGAGGNDLLSAGDGADVLDGGAGNDTLDGGPGNDTLTGGLGTDLLIGGSGTDRAVVGVSFANASITRLPDGSVRIVSTQGDDIHHGIEVFQFTDRSRTLAELFPSTTPSAGADSISGTVGNDTIDLLAGNDSVQGLAGNDLIYGGAGLDLIYGDRGHDRIYGGADADLIFAGDENDTVYGGTGRDVIWLGAGNDLFIDDAETGSTGSDEVHGGTGNDTLRGSGGNDTLYGESDADWLEGGTGNDLLDGGWQADTIYGGSGNDSVMGNYGRDVIWLDDGDDLFLDTAQSDAFANDLINGGAGRDTITALGGNDTGHGDDGDDVLTGGDGDDVLFGGAGNDRIDGGNQSDRLFGGDGNDTVTGGAGRDYIELGAGDDLFLDDETTGAFGSDRVAGGTGNDTILGRGGDDTLLGEDGFDSIEGGSGNDLINGGGNADTLHGGSNNDTVYGGLGTDAVWLDSGNDVFIDEAQTGLLGADTVYGGSGNDTIHAGGGRDLFIGGDGADTFIFARGVEADRIADFQVGIDILRLDRTLTGTTSEASVIGAARVVGGALVFSYGTDSITLDGVTSTAGFADSLVIF